MNQRYSTPQAFLCKNSQKRNLSSRNLLSPTSLTLNECNLIGFPLLPISQKKEIKKEKRVIDIKKLFEESDESESEDRSNLNLENFPKDAININFKQ